MIDFFGKVTIFHSASTGGWSVWEEVGRGVGVLGRRGECELRT